MTPQEKLQEYFEQFESYVKTHNPDTDYNFKFYMFIAGGSIRDLIQGETPKDIDIFVLNEIPKSVFENVPKSFETDNAITFHINGMKYQVIKKPEHCMMTCIDQFDFTINSNFYDPHREYLYMKSESDIQNKQLVINPNNRNKLGTLARIVKFVERGYKIPNRTNLLRLGVELTHLEPVKDCQHLKDECRLHLSSRDYENISQEVTGFRFTLVTGSSNADSEGY